MAVSLWPTDEWYLRGSDEVTDQSFRYVGPENRFVTL